MKRNGITCLAAALLVAWCLPTTAQESGYWRAASSTAQSVTGDVGLSDTRLLIDFSSFPVARARDLQAGEVSSVFDVDSNSNGKGHLYGLSIPASKKFMHKNTLCGTEDTQWMVTYVSGNTLHLAFFSGQKAPVFTLDAISNSTNLCGTYLYVR